MKSCERKELEKHLEDLAHPIGFKVTTLERKSLGLRNNLTILKYPFNRWYFLPESKVIEGKGYKGGIWTCPTLGLANKLSKYAESRGIKTKIFRAYLSHRFLYDNAYRIKVNGLKLVEEIKLRR